jgi:hypothetical protein
MWEQAPDRDARDMEATLWLNNPPNQIHPRS